MAADWQAPIERNRYEARWMQVASAAVPGSAPRVLGQHRELGVLVMGYLPDHTLWKQQLRDGGADMRHRARRGPHAGAHPCPLGGTARTGRATFDSQAIFFDIRLEPYLLATAEAHPDLPTGCARWCADAGSCLALVHGDVSPKNILVGTRRGPVLLDAECAVWGDPAFDLAFC